MPALSALLTLTTVWIAQATPAAVRGMGPLRSAERGPLEGGGALGEALQELPARTAWSVIVRSPADARRLLAGRLAGVAEGDEDPLVTLGLGLPGVPPEPEAWIARGLDPQAPAWTWRTGPDRPTLLRLALRDAALARQRLGASSRGPTDTIRVLEAAGETPVACLVEDTRVTCQRGASPGPDPFADLRGATDPQETLGVQQSADLVRAADPDAVVSAWIRPGALSGVLAEHARRWSARRGFEGPEETAASARRLQGLARLGESIPALLLTLAPSGRGLRARAEIAIGGRLRRVVLAFPDLEVGDQLARWVATPGLYQVRAALPPAMLAELLGPMLTEFPPELLTGQVGAIGLGVDSACPAARSADPTRAAALPFLVPSALAFATRAPPSPAHLARWTAALGGEWDPDKQTLRRDVGGERVELQVVEQALLLSSGPGSGHAARRRWRSNVAPLRVPERTFFDARLDVGALSAALSVARGAEPTSGLRRLEQAVRALEAAGGGQRVLLLRARRSGDGDRVSLVAETSD